MYSRKKAVLLASKNQQAALVVVLHSLPLQQ